MQDFLLNHEMAVRATAFVSIFLIVALAEIIAPRRKGANRLKRWPLNLGMVVLGSLAIRMIVPLIAVEAALRAADADIGLFNLVDLPRWVELVAAILLLDLAIYAQHVAFHRIPLLWRIHRMHHSDLMLDATSGIRFHPFEFVLSMLIKVGVVTALGADVVAVIVFEILLNATAMFNHGNLRLPERLDRMVRRILVTPDFHLVHHSTLRRDHDRNYGFNLPWWDYAFGTYKARPDKGLKNMQIGLPQWRSQDQLGLKTLLWTPFLSNSPDNEKGAPPAHERQHS
ncbi:sterol desaturase [Iodidimonas muriae]|uniref:Sterol desaturase n=1 Tax=Iodidimonas muriae TaxID=261467 RepID=A0ABQ2L9T5_9PROT|nr:sterol desaturase family protein [Iodidimonas muriae]GER06014.1 sterol desaturase [Kordiimonadales bacterium JCM 17843]GGO07837.1 sterol desaturase [Iodidimonas muriae]